ncbi:unnamed protein product [Meloidogyne enterolobii]|uniref:Uncharacterized protein n=1 Tax=Meloidogyne enterolobii TaxID=390850 RepID=A0ACB1AUN2_MELEN
MPLILAIFHSLMLNFLIIIIYLIIKTHSWTWEDYPSPREATYFKCGIQNRTFVCDPDGMLTDQQRKEIVTLVEDFKEKTKRPLSTIPCMREGLRLVVALAKDKIGPEDGSNGLTYLCKNERNWTSSYKTTCDADVQGIELNTDGFRYCYSNTRWLMPLHVDEYEWLGKEDHHLKNKKYYDALKDYIENMQMLYIHRFSIFDNKDPNEDIASQQSYNKVGRHSLPLMSRVDPPKLVALPFPFLYPFQWPFQLFDSLPTSLPNYQKEA